jgi:hypothetical protein
MIAQRWDSLSFKEEHQSVHWPKYERGIMPQSQLTINGVIVDVTSLILTALSVIRIELIPYPILRLVIHRIQ